jgi:hypothetical protein
MAEKWMTEKYLGLFLCYGEHFLPALPWPAARAGAG